MKNTVNGRPSGTGLGVDVLNPATLEVVDTVNACRPEAVDAACRAAHAALPVWAASDEARQAALRECLKVLVDHHDELAVLLSKEQGKPLAQARQELLGSARILQWYADVELQESVLRDTPRERIVARRRPIGVVGLITPWNFPITILGMKLWATLRAGNTVVVKPAPTTPLTTLRYAELIASVLPAGVVNTVTGEGLVGQMLTTHPLVDKISFTGSTATGRSVMANSAETLKRLTLELGGNDPAILLDDADLDAAIPVLVRGSFHNAGQVCQAIKRVFVPTRLVDEVVERMVTVSDSYMVVGCGQDEAVTVGPVNNPAQQRFVQDLVTDAAERGATIHELGAVKYEGLPGYFVRPVIVTGLDASAPLVTEEQFGPALPIVAYDDLDALVDGLNADEYGLDASVWSADEEKALGIASRLRVGQVYVNSHAGPPDPEIPFGGVKGSGFGRELGLRGLDDVSELQVLKVARNGGPS
ncbi:aldehyde dehydrogenase family protein [Streptomyces sp. NPDC090499]|uniref:aldehyde dehydrogenase family protein n=1 Tax=unclassified Streptomyces TaxID=2593676 RepID=UPI0038106905